MGEEYPGRHDLSSLRLLGTVGEPINPEAWVWYWQVIGGERCPIVDTWWQTENGRHPDHAAAGCRDDEARLGDDSLPRDPARRSSTSRATRWSGATAASS